MSTITPPATPTARTSGSWRHRVRRLAEAAVTPLDLDDVLDVFAPLRSGADLRGRIVSVTPETTTSATILIEPGRDWAGHLPGQYLRVGVDVAGVRRWRTYSLTHGPRADRRISITVKAVPDGVVSGHLVHRARAGELIHLGQAEGDFVLPDAQGRPLPAKLLLVTAGSGITPVIGMLRNLFSRAVAPAVDIVLLHSALSRAEVIFGAELRDYGARGLIRLVELHTGESGRLETGDLAALVPDLAERTTYACGPVGLLDSLEAHHGALGLPLTVERFRLPGLSAQAAGEGGTLTFADGRTVEAAGGVPLLDVAEDAGVLMPSGCRMGVCFGCVLPLRSGVVRDLRNGEITVAAPGDGVAVQTCISAATGPCVLDH